MATKRLPRAAIRKANRKRPPSSLELTIYKWLEEAKIPFKKEKAIGRCHVDIFLVPNVCIELNGCYFHSHKGCQPETLKSKKIRLKDYNRYKFLASKGNEIHVIWECEVKNSPEVVKKLLNSLYKPK